MGKANDKKVVRKARNLLCDSLSNLLESHRERRFTYSQKATPLSRRLFCRRNQLAESQVSHIETGRFLDISFDQLRIYLVTTYGRNNKEFATSFHKVYEGLKEIDSLLTML